MEFRTPYDGKRERHVVLCEEPSLTKQEFQKECDINVIMARYSGFGTLPEMRPGGMYGDFSSLGDLLDCQDVVARAEEAFGALPSKVRDRFANDPVNLVQFVLDERNREEAVRLGLIEVAAAVVEPVVEPAVPAVKKVAKKIVDKG